MSGIVLRHIAERGGINPEANNENSRVIRDQSERNHVKGDLVLPERYILLVGGVTPLKNIPASVGLSAESRTRECRTN